MPVVAFNKGALDQEDASRTLFISYAMRYMAGGHALRGAADMGCLIVEENIGAEGFQELGLGHTPQEQRFVDTDMPGP